jgi:hypothetical protein
MMKTVALEENFEFAGYLEGNVEKVDFDFLNGCDIVKVWVFKANAEALELVVSSYSDEIGEGLARMMEYLEVAEYSWNNCYEGVIASKNSGTCVDVASNMGRTEAEMLELVASMGYTLEKLVTVGTETVETF